MKTRDQLRILLLQIRDDQRVREEELNSFAAYSGLAVEQIDILNVFDQPKFGAEVLAGYDALYVGGASEASVLEPDTYPFIRPSQDLLLAAIAQSLPTFASCFGFQLAVCALGGQIVHTPQQFEMGTLPIRLTDLAKSDPIFRDVPDGFHAVSVHQMKAVETPPGCELLAYTDECVHSFRVKGKPFWTFQFHPEVDRATLVERLTIYKDHYTESDGHLDEVLSTAVETPKSNRLVRSFIDRVVLAP